MGDQHWDPIPPHAVEIAGAWMLPERLVYPDGQKPYVRCYLHGLIPADHKCGESPSDHFCGVEAHPNHVEGDDHDDQCTPHDEWNRYQGWDRKRLRDVLTEAREELARWGWGDMHYGSQGQEQRVVDMLAKIDAALSHSGGGDR